MYTQMTRQSCNAPFTRIATRQEFLEVAQEVIIGQLGKDPALPRYVAERVVLRTKDVRQAIQVAKLCDSPEEVDRFEGGAMP